MAKLVTVPQAAAKNLATEARDSAIRAGVLTFIALVVGGVVKHALVILAIGLTVGGLVVAAVYALIAFRAFSIWRRMPAEARRVTVVGWTRAPDGTNYAIFPTGADIASAPPELVLKLIRPRDVVETRAFLLDADGSRGSAALVDNKGTVLAVGRLRGAANAQKVWQRRSEPTPWWAGAGNRKPRPAARKRR